MKSLIKTFLFTIPIFAQTPADSLFRAPDTTPFQKLFLYPIAKTIYHNGVLKGLIQTSDRIVRCNPSAHDAHKKMNGSFHTDGRLKDSIVLKRNRDQKRSPLLAAGLSMAVPGLGRAYGGRPFDGVYGFLMSSFAISAGIKGIENKSVLSPLFVGVGLTIYMGEIYGAYRTAKYYSN